MSKIIFLDIDDTLLDHEKYNKVLDSTTEAIQKAQKNGHKIILCTGRTKSNVHPDLIPFKSDGEIYGAGTTILADGKMLLNVSIPKQDLLDMIQDFNKYEFGYTLEGEFESFCDDFCTERRKHFAAHHGVTQEREDILSSEDTHFHMREFFEDTIMNKITIFAKTKQDLDAFIEKWKDRYDCVIHPEKENRIPVEILIKNISKASGMDIILDHFHKTLEDSIAFGDSMNDYEMIAHAHTGVVMGNGNEKLKEIADIVCARSSEDAIYETFQKLNLI